MGSDSVQIEYGPVRGCYMFGGQYMLWPSSTVVFDIDSGRSYTAEQLAAEVREKAAIERHREVMAALQRIERSVDALRLNAPTIPLEKIDESQRMMRGLFANVVWEAQNLDKYMQRLSACASCENVFDLSDERHAMVQGHHFCPACNIEAIAKANIDGGGET